MNEIPEVLQKWKTHYFAPLGIELRKTLSQVLVAIEAHQRADHRLLEALICLNAGGIAINPARWLTEAQTLPSPPTTRVSPERVSKAVAAIQKDPAAALLRLAKGHSATALPPKWSPSDFTKMGEHLSRKSFPPKKARGPASSRNRRGKKTT